MDQVTKGKQICCLKPHFLFVLKAFFVCPLSVNDFESTYGKLFRYSPYGSSNQGKTNMLFETSLLLICVESMKHIEGN